MNGVVRRKLPKKRRHRLGVLRIGPQARLWCSCTWKWSGELPASQERAKFEEHFA